MKSTETQKSQFEGVYEIITTPKEKELGDYVKKAREKLEKE